MNKKIENKTKEMIQKYAEYRGDKDERITYENLLEVYISADRNMRSIYKREMVAYIKAVDEGKLEKGLPIVVAELSN
jgi:hypothetical protein